MSEDWGCRDNLLAFFLPIPQAEDPGDDLLMAVGCWTVGSCWALIFRAKYFFSPDHLILLELKLLQLEKKVRNSEAGPEAANPQRELLNQEHACPEQGMGQASMP